MAIAWQVVPLFQITPPYPAWLRRSTVPVILFLFVAKSALTGAGQGPGPEYIGVVLDMIIAGYLVCFAMATLLLQNKARRKIKDSHRNYWRLAMVNLVAAVIVWVIAKITGNPVYDLLVAVIYLLGFAMAVVIGMLLKIFSFLVWLHLQTLNDSLKMKGEKEFNIPKMKTVISPRTCDRLLSLLMVAQVTVVAALFLPETIPEVAAILWLAVFAFLGGVLWRTAWRYRVLHRKMTANT
jgi:4-hydroxybenzoate polyprenyltransferase